MALWDFSVEVMRRKDGWRLVWGTPEGTDTQNGLSMVETFRDRRKPGKPV